MKGGWKETRGHGQSPPRGQGVDFADMFQIGTCVGGLPCSTPPVPGRLFFSDPRSSPLRLFPGVLRGRDGPSHCARSREVRVSTCSISGSHHCALQCLVSNEFSMKLRHQGFVSMFLVLVAFAFAVS